ncbi:hypothetical protein IFM89_037034 [Coptis chinensis]|uniref:GDSL esterase/lipase n=1 Tax=Coptis chinensis TaxID=261450 RepID=A0A835H7K4_9MAGN|nr:hypothetical protein IFM89_037034 [Coptis chinensis]
MLGLAPLIFANHGERKRNCCPCRHEIDKTDLDLNTTRPNKEHLLTLERQMAVIAKLPDGISRLKEQVYDMMDDHEEVRGTVTSLQQQVSVSPIETEKLLAKRDMGQNGGASPHLLVHLLVLILLVLPCVYSQCNKAPIIFNFGDSNSDTGGLVAGLGFTIKFPYGRTFFHRSTGRLSDGRLVIDFLCESLNSSYLSPYLDSLGSNFENGANFAIVGSSTLPKYLPFSLNIQAMQFLHFKARSVEVIKQDFKHLMDDQGFRDALYMFDIGQNDLSDAFSKNLSYAQVVRRIPLVLAEIRYAITTIYAQGGKNFWIHNTGPLGCLPQKLSIANKNDRLLDQHGCVVPYNDATKIFNRGLFALCEALRSKLKNVNIVYVDIYTIKYDLIANATKYGLENPLMACCGFGGPPYNYNINLKCGQGGNNICRVESRYISWDGVHYTEAANTIIASKILSTAYSTPQLKFNYFCQS